MSERKKAERVKYAPLAGGQQTLRRKKPCCHWFAARYTLSIFLFCGFFMLYSLRVNLSVAIVAMVNGTAVIGNTSSSRDCPALDGSVYNVTTDLENRGEFSWDENVQGMVLGSFFYGYVLTQIPGGRLAELLGAKWLLGGGILVTSVLTLLTPSAARWSPAALMALRFLEGICEGVVFPSAAALLSHWVPVHERSRMLSFNMIGTSMGTVVTLPLTALLCGSQLFGGWPSVFYFFGTVMGIVNCMGNLSGMLAPLVTGFFIEHDESLVQWKKLFLLSSAIYTFGALSFLMFGSAKLEDWGALPTEKSSIVSFRHPDSGSSDNEEDFRTAAEMHLM
ncbi:sialin [Ixodes scapularis]